MKKLWHATVAAALALIVAGSLATIAQVFTLPANTTFLGHFIAGAAAPPTGTTCTISAGSSDTAGDCVTSGTSATITFNTAFTIAPSCVMHNRGSTFAPTSIVFATGFTVSNVNNGGTVGWICAAKIGG
jgi:hypothetical protein